MQPFLQQFLYGLSLGSTYALIALGYTMVYGVLRLINFAHGEIYMVGAVAGYHLSVKVAPLPIPWPVKLMIVFIGAMIACALLGFVIEVCAYRPLRHKPRLVSLITAIGVSLLLQNIAQKEWFFGPNFKLYPAEFFPIKTLISFHVGSSQTPVTLSNLDVLKFVLSGGIMVGLSLFIHKTRAGLGIRAVAHSVPAASLMGVNTNRIISITFIIGSAMAAIAGVLDGIQYNVKPLMGMLPGIKAFIAAVLGGIGSIPGAFVGAIILGLAETFARFYLPSGYTEYADGVAYLILILILLFKPSGLLGKKTVEKL